MTIRLPDEVYEELRRVAFDRRVPMNEIVTDAVREHLSALAGDVVREAS